MISPQEILSFWFKEAGPSKWYNGGASFDAEIRHRYELFCVNLAADLRTKFAHDWLSNPESMLALIIALDQFPRNMFRETKAAFAFDDLALSATKRAIVAGFDLKTPQDRRAFIYMPLMHSENIADQNQCVELMDSRIESESSLFHAVQHKKIIEKFGRFPHRNAILGRESTPDELEYLQSGAYSP